MEGADVFARLVQTLEPYLEDVVFIGGWVHSLYVLELEGSGGRTVRTHDIDIAIPRSLQSDSRPTLLELVREAGFDREPMGDESGLVRIRKGTIDLDILTEAPDPRRTVRIEGQPELHVQGYPDQDFLRSHSRQYILGPQVGMPLDRPVVIRIPTIGAYLIGKILSSATRQMRGKGAKDIVYVHELIRRRALAGQIRAELPALLRSSPAVSERSGRRLREVIRDDRFLAEVALQVIEGSGFAIEDPSTTQASIRASLRRLHGESWPEPTTGPA